MTHCERILQIFQCGGSITQLDAMKWDDPCLRLGARVKDLRSGKHDGIKYNILTINERNGDGKGFHAKYVMPQYYHPPRKVILPPAYDTPKKVEKQKQSLFT